MPRIKRCSVDGCQGNAKSNGMCQRHYQRERAKSAHMRRQTDGTKLCRACGEDKPVTEFLHHGGTRDGRRPECGPCMATYHRKHRTTIVDRWKTQRKYTLKKLYGITIEDYNDMFLSQDGRCAICDDHVTELSDESDLQHVLHVDHDHETGVVRGLLCGSCNKGIGSLKDDATLLKKAAAYLERQRS